MQKSSLRKVTLVKGNGMPMKSQKQERNSTCKCGSGRKAKRCCGDDSTYYYNQNSQKETSEKK